ncbi:MAG: glycogen synthase GlgA [Acidobacteriota bacterium]
MKKFNELKNTNLKILIVTPEAFPLARTGGLGDVAGSLVITLSKLNQNVALAMPKYKKKEIDLVSPQLEMNNITLSLGNEKVKGAVYSSKIDSDIDVYFIDNPKYFYREELYGTSHGDYLDNDERFIFFSKVLIEFLINSNKRFDIIHCNDWQTALIPLFLKTIYSNNGIFQETATVYTIHNLAYQGLFPPESILLTGLGWSYFTPDKLEFWGKLNFMKAGLLYSDVINTVSKKYSHEIQTEEFGCGLEGVLKKRRDSLFGILNGVDYKVWNPTDDRMIKANYSIRSIYKKQINKEDLIKETNLKINPKWPLIGMISRLAEQKGFDLLTKILDKLMEIDLGIVILGKGDKKYEDELLKFKERYPNKMAARIEFNEILSHKIEAGADIFLIPSKYEPCGLNQMYSLKYGTVPVVRATGGLDDTIIEFDPKTETGNGFKFENYSPEDFLNAIKKALEVYKDKKKWEKLIKNGMKQDFSWGQSAKEYLNLYKFAIEKRLNRKIF